MKHIVHADIYLDHFIYFFLIKYVPLLNDELYVLNSNKVVNLTVNILPVFQTVC